MKTSAQIVVGQKYVTITIKKETVISDAIIQIVTDTQKEIEKANMVGISVLVKQIVTSGKYNETIIIILDLMQIVHIQSGDKNDEVPKKSRLEVFR